MPAEEIYQLAKKITESPAFRERFAQLQNNVAKVRLSFDAHPIASNTISRLLLQGSVLALSEEVAHRTISQKINALIYESIPNEETTNYAVQILTSRLGNFPVISSDSQVFGANNIMRSLEDAAGILNTLDPEVIGDLVDEEENARVEIRGKVFHFNFYQKEILSALAETPLVSFSAPTSFGKSFVVRHHIAAEFASGRLRRSLIIVPTKSLIDDFYESLHELKRTLDLDFGIYTHSRSVENIPQKCVFILTQERLTFLLEKDPALVRSFEVVYCDEAHYISRGYRGFVLRSVIQRLADLCGLRGVNGNTQYIFSSPIIKNPVYYQERFFPLLTNGQSFHKQIVYSPVEKNVHLVSKGPRDFSFILLRDSINGETFKERQEQLGTHSFPQELQGENRDDLKTKEIFRDIHILLNSNLQARTILYTTSPLKAHQYADRLAENLPNKHTLGDRELSDLKRYIADHYDESFGLIEMIQKGVGLHYGKMPISLRRQVVRLFEDGHVDYLVCTSTLLEGVNLPAKNIFLFSNKHNGRNSHTALSFWNLLGRAGRITFGLSGNVFCVSDNPTMYEDLFEKKEVEIKDPAEEVAQNATKQNHVISSFLNDEREFYYVRSPYRSDVEYLIYELLTSQDLGPIVEKFHLREQERSELIRVIERTKGSMSLPSELLQMNPGIDPRLQDSLFLSLRALSLSELMSLLSITSNPLAANRESLSQILSRTSESLRWPLPNNRYDAVERTSARIAMWLHELSLSQFIQQVLRHNEDKSRLERVELALNVVEFLDSEISFSAPRYIKCFFDLVLRVAFEKGIRDVTPFAESVELFLFAIESGVSSPVGRFLFESGVARGVAIRANSLVEELAGGQVDRTFFDRPDVLTQLRDGLSSIAFNELMDHLEV